jgi:hypothetical protein
MKALWHHERRPLATGLPKHFTTKKQPWRHLPKVVSFDLVAPGKREPHGEDLVPALS